MVDRHDERYQRAIDDSDEALSNPMTDEIGISDGGGIGRERNQPNLSETGVMGGGGGSWSGGGGSSDRDSGFSGGGGSFGGGGASGSW